MGFFQSRILEWGAIAFSYQVLTGDLLEKTLMLGRIEAEEEGDRG